MARKPRPWYRADRDAWYCQWKDQQHRLAEGKGNEGAAWLALSKLMAGEAGPVASELRVDAMLMAYLARTGRECGADAVATYSWVLQGFSAALGSHAAEGVKPHQVSAWLDSHPGWGNSTRRLFLSIVKGAFRWAESEGHIGVNPTRFLKLATASNRDAVLVGEQARAIVGDALHPEFGLICEALWETGCRPNEAYRLEASGVDLGAGTWRVVNKLRRRGEPTRLVYLGERMVEVSRGLVEAHPEGPLFRDDKGRAWDRASMKLRFIWLRKHLRWDEGKRFGAEATAYAFRHLFITDALERGVPIATVAELVGHASTAMIMRVYSKLSERTAHLRAAVGVVRPGRQ